MEESFGAILLIVLMIFAYLLPMVIAISRGHNNAAPISITNIILGWSGIAWIICLIWAFTCNVKEQAK